MNFRTFELSNFRTFQRSSVPTFELPVKDRVRGAGVLASEDKDQQETGYRASDMGEEGHAALRCWCEERAYDLRDYPYTYHNYGRHIGYGCVNTEGDQRSYARLREQHQVGTQDTGYRARRTQVWYDRV